MAPHEWGTGGRFKLRTADLRWRAVENEIVALDLNRSEYLAVNRVGAVLWEALVEGADRETLVGLLAKRFGRERRSAEEDLETFLSALDEQGLLQSGPPES